MLVLVTGAAGSLGRQVCLELLRHRYSVRGLDVPTADFSSLIALDGFEKAVGDIRDADFVRQAVSDCSWVLHLAAVLPPVSELDRERTMSVNVEGTTNLVEALEVSGSEAPLVFTSTVTVYGDTSTEPPPVTADRPLRPINSYGESKARMELFLKERGYPATVLRITGVAVPAVLELPESWPFSSEQRVEFISLDDVAQALLNCVGNKEVVGSTLNISGGDTWQMTGCQYVQGYCGAYGIPIDETTFSELNGPYDWYDSAASQQTLDYQRTSHPKFLRMLSQALDMAFGD